MSKRPTLYKDDLVRIYAEQEGITKTEAKKRVDDILGLISDSLVLGENVKMNNFFNFFVRELKAKEGKNPYTKKPMVIPATRSVHARMTKPLKDRIQGKRD
jgi:nucleoid DNA-binding protein